VKHLLAVLLFVASVAFAQVNVTSVTGTVTDPTGAAVPGAAVTVTSADTGEKFNTTTSDKGEYTVPSIPAGTYQVLVTKAGFKAEAVEKVGLLVGVPGTVDVKLQVGQTSETVEVVAGAEILQTATADVSTNLQGRQLTDLPFATRNAVELLVDAPGTSTPTTPRSSSINGLPKGAINITIDGMNTQDNNLKSSDGYFSYIMPSVDALQEVTMTSSAAGVDSTSQGGVQIKFVTRSGTNAWHGGGFWQVRNTDFDANYFFNNQIGYSATNPKGLPRDIIKLNQEGGHIGGPIVKNKLFFFGNVEVYRFPGTNTYSRNYLTPSASSGIYTYADSAGAIHNVNTLALAQAAGFPSTPDPILAKTYALMQTLGAQGTAVKTNQATSDYNTLNTSYQPNGLDARDFFTTRIDYNINKKNTLSFVYNFDWYVSVPDLLNNIVPDFPGSGTGTVLFTNVSTGQRSNRFDGTISLRSVLSSNLTNEYHMGLNGGTVLFFDAVSPGMFGTWRGYEPTFASPGTSLANVSTTAGPQRRNAPVKSIGDTVTWLKGRHQISAGFNWDQINLFQVIVGTSEIPHIAMGIATGDPINNGTTNLFTAGNFPGASSTQLGQAANLYADVTGRVSSISSQLVLGEQSHQYGIGAPIDRDQLREYGLFFQDQWRVLPNLTATIGFRVEKQTSFSNLDGLYSQVSNAALWGLSGVGNLFKPGTLTGVVPSYTQLTGNPYNPPLTPAPSVGLAWNVPSMEGPLGWLLGHHSGSTVLRGGYAVATVREGMGVYQSLYGSNQGITEDSSIAPTTYPANFGAAGSVLFGQAALPSRVSTLAATETFPIPATFTTSLNGFAPNLKTGYVQSWNLSFQRELDKNTVLEIRYNANHGTDLWRQMALDEVNTLENGFLSQFEIAQNNLAIARGGNILNNQSTVFNFGNQGLPGQQNVPILSTAIGNTTDSTTAGYLTLGQAGSSANSIATNSGRMASLTAAGYPANLFVVNPTVASGNSYILTNNGSSTYNALNIEVRRRLAQGFTVQGSYTFAKALATGATASSSDFSTPTTLRNYALDHGPSSFDIRNAIKFNWIYELPVGPGKAFASGLHNPILKNIIGGWQIAGVVRLQSGTPLFLSGGFDTFNAANGGIVLHNITMKQLQNDVGIYKTNLQGSAGSIVYYLPPPTSGPVSVSATTGLPTPTTTGLNSANNTNLITNTEAAFQSNGLLATQVDPNAPYISPAPVGQMGCLTCAIYLPWQHHFDLNLQKNIRFGERVNMTIRVTALDVLNITNFLPGSNIGSSFGQVTSAYRDISGTVDPGSRIIEFQARVNF
jgi:hypothetical protein